MRIKKKTQYLNRTLKVKSGVSGFRAFADFQLVVMKVTFMSIVVYIKAK